MCVTWSQSHIVLRMGASHCKSAPCLVWCSWVFCRQRYNVFKLSWEFMDESSLWYVTALTSLVTISIVVVEVQSFWLVKRPLVKPMFKWLYKWKPLAVSHHFAMFGEYWSNSSGDIKYFVCHLTAQNPVIEGSSNFMSWNSSQYVTTLLSLVTIGIVAIEMFFLASPSGQIVIWLFLFPVYSFKKYKIKTNPKLCILIYFKRYFKI